MSASSQRLGRRQVRTRKQASRRPTATSDADGLPVGLRFGPSTPKGLERNWIETLPGKGFLVGFRACHPTEGLFDGSWKLNDVDKLK